MRCQPLDLLVLACLQAACSGSHAPPASPPDAAIGVPSAEATAPNPHLRDAEIAERRTGDAGGPSASDGGIAQGAAPKVIRHDQCAEVPPQGVERAPKIRANDGEGYLDIARSSDGNALWVQLHRDDGETTQTHFVMEPNGHEGLVLQLVDGAREPGEAQPWDRTSTTDSNGQTLVHKLQAWPIDPVKGLGYDAVAHTWLPMVPAKGRPTAAARKRVQWTFKVERCDGTSACLYYGSPADVCGKYAAANPNSREWLMSIVPAKCTGQW